MELLVAMVLLAIAVPLAYRGLTGLLQTNARTEAEMLRWQGLAFVFERLEVDLTQVLKRPARNSDGTLLAPLVGDAVTLEFSRIAEEQAPRRQRYLFKDEQLWLVQLPQPDRGRGRDPDPVPILDGIAQLRLSFLDANGNLQSGWQDPGRLPSALGIDLTLVTGEHINRLFALP